MPTLLLESLNVLHTFGKENGVQVYINQIIEILQTKKNIIMLDQASLMSIFSNSPYKITFVLVDATG